MGPSSGDGRSRSVDAFAAWHARQPDAWEFVDGMPLRVAKPPPLVRTLIKGNAFVSLANHLEESGFVALIGGSEVRSDRISAIPDGVVLRRPIDFKAAAIFSPVVIGEVVEPRQEAFVERKMRAYRLIPSVRHLLCFACDRREITVATRTGPEAWRLDVIAGEGIAMLGAIGATLRLDKVYEDIPGLELSPDA